MLLGTSTAEAGPKIGKAVPFNCGGKMRDNPLELSLDEVEYIVGEFGSLPPEIESQLPGEVEALSKLNGRCLRASCKDEMLSTLSQTDES